MMSILDEISKVVVKLIIREPFYGHYFTHLQRESDDKIARSSVKLTDSGNVSFVVNPKYWKQLQTNESKIGCIKHQILHLIFGHVYQSKNYGNTSLFNLAADLVVNQYLSAEQLSPDAITLDHLSFLKLKPHESVGYYYHQLQKIMEKISTSSSSENSQGESGDSDQENGNNGESSSNNEENDNQSGNSTSAVDQIQKIIEEKTDAQGNNPTVEHQEWETFENQSGAEAKHTKDQLDSYAEMSMRRVSDKDMGDLQASLQRSISEAIKRLNPRVSWKRMLRLFMQSSRKTYLKNTLKKPSKRYGIVPGIKIQQKQKILVAIDTSGSIQEKELNAFFGELYYIYRCGGEIRVIECDCQIKNQYEYRGVQPETVLGGGCTDFDPPIIIANTYRPDVVIYFTDGYAEPLTVKSRSPIIWVISSNGIDHTKWDFLPGKKIKLKS